MSCWVTEPAGLLQPTFEGAVSDPADCHERLKPGNTSSKSKRRIDSAGAAASAGSGRGFPQAPQDPVAQSTRSGATPQISVAYSRSVRSLEKRPMAATLRIDIAFQSAGLR